jgi:hypothetical protein
MKEITSMETFYGHQVTLVEEKHEGMLGTVKIVIAERAGREPITLWLRRAEAKELARAINQDVRRINTECATKGVQ